MKIQIDTFRYNNRRYGKPYIAAVDFSKSSSGEPRWGEWVGQAGEPGLLEIDAEPGDVLMKGQKDFRNPRNSAPDYFILSADGTRTKVSKVDAYRHFKSRSAVAT